MARTSLKGVPVESIRGKGIRTNPLSLDTSLLKVLQNLIIYACPQRVKATAPATRQVSSLAIAIASDM